VTHPPPATLHIVIIHRTSSTDRYAAELRSIGFRVTEALEDVKEVGCALAARPNLILLASDLEAATTTRLYAQFTAHRIPVIALTGAPAVGAHGLRA
jgi:hypothetical protein